MKTFALIFAHLSAILIYAPNGPVSESVPYVLLTLLLLWFAVETLGALSEYDDTVAIRHIASMYWSDSMHAKSQREKDIVIASHQLFYDSRRQP